MLDEAIPPGHLIIREMSGDTANRALLESLLTFMSMVSRGADVYTALITLGLNAREASFLFKHPKHLARLSLLVGVGLVDGDASMVANLAQGLADKRRLFRSMLVLVRNLRNKLIDSLELDAQQTPRAPEDVNLEIATSILASELCANPNYIMLDSSTFDVKWTQIKLALPRALELRQELMFHTQARASTQPRVL